MTEFVHLVGAEDVLRAGNAMREAASTMKHAADMIDQALRDHRQFSENWLVTFEKSVKEFYKSFDENHKQNKIEEVSVRLDNALETLSNLLADNCRDQDVIETTKERIADLRAEYQVLRQTQNNETEKT
jgi:hypothetical protein